MSAATSQPIPEFYTWGFSGAPIQIQLNLDVVRGIRKQIQDSEKAPGLLVGVRTAYRKYIQARDHEDSGFQVREDTGCRVDRGGEQ